MSLSKPEKPKDLNDVYDFMQEIFNNLDFNSINAGDLKTIAPTTDTLDKGKFRLTEIAGVPTLYYRNLAGTIYKSTLVLA